VLVKLVIMPELLANNRLGNCSATPRLLVSACGLLLSPSPQNLKHDRNDFIAYRFVR
jgi:hypothetical protein